MMSAAMEDHRLIAKGSSPCEFVFMCVLDELTIWGKRLPASWKFSLLALNLRYTQANACIISQQIGEFS